MNYTGTYPTHTQRAPSFKPKTLLNKKLKKQKISKNKKRGQFYQKTNPPRIKNKKKAQKWPHVHQNKRPGDI
jgi:hypothetical protein